MFQTLTVAPNFQEEMQIKFLTNINEHISHVKRMFFTDVLTSIVDLLERVLQRIGNILAK